MFFISSCRMQPKNEDVFSALTLRKHNKIPTIKINDILEAGLGSRRKWNSKTDKISKWALNSAQKYMVQWLRRLFQWFSPRITCQSKIRGKVIWSTDHIGDWFLRPCPKCDSRHVSKAFIRLSNIYRHRITADLKLFKLFNDVVWKMRLCRIRRFYVKIYL